MAYRISFNIAGVRIGIKSSVPPKKEIYPVRYLPFIEKINKSPDIEIILDTIPDYQRFKQKVIFEARRKKFYRSGKIDKRTLKIDPAFLISSAAANSYVGKGLDWRIGKINNGLIFEGGMGTKYQLLIDKGLKIGKLFIVSADRGWVISELLHGCLQVLLVYYLAKFQKGLVLHACGLKDGNRGLIFAGLSGAGKSTTGRIWNQAGSVKVLNDDRIIVKKEKSAFYAFSTPWHGDYADYLKSADLENKARLSGVFYIYHSRENLAKKIPPLEAFGLLFKTLFLPFWEGACVDFCSGLLEDIVNAVPTYKFGFQNNKSIIRYIRSLR